MDGDDFRWTSRTLNPANDLLIMKRFKNVLKITLRKVTIKDALVYLSDEWASGVMNPDDITIVVIKRLQLVLKIQLISFDFPFTLIGS